MQNNSLSNEQKVQEDEYQFPYHFLTNTTKGIFHQARTLEWGYEYQSYIDFLVALVHKEKFNSLLDIGCGEGRFIYELQKAMPDKKLVGSDFSNRVITFAKAFNPSGTFIVGDITDASLDIGQFDIITLIETLEHIEPNKIDGFMSSVEKRLSKNGIFIITVPSTTREVNAKHYQHFTLSSLTEAVSPYFIVRDHFFLNKVGFANYFIKRLLSNRFYFLNEKHLLKIVYAFYNRCMLHGAFEKTQRICVVCTKA